MDDLMIQYVEWYWSWGKFVIGIALFCLGFVCGWFEHKQKCIKLMREERIRIATNAPGEDKVYLEDLWEES